MNALLNDCHHALRLYVRTPGASLVAILVLAVSMAFVCAFVSLYVSFALKPHPGFHAGGRITTIGESDGVNLNGAPYTLIDRLPDEMSSIEAAANPRPAALVVGTGGDTETTMHVTKGFFTGLRPKLALGRGFLEEEHAPDAEPVVVLAWRYWQREYGGDPDVLDDFLEIGRVPGDSFLTMNDSPFRLPSDSDPQPERERAQFRIVGVMSEELAEIPGRGNPLEPVVWLPSERVWPMFLGESAVLPRTIPFATYVRRAPGVSVRALANELRARYDTENPDWNLNPGYRTDALDGIVSDVVVYREAKRQLEFLLAGSVMLALVAAANVSLFLLARAPGRRRELGIRLAVGAPKRRIARQLATEAGLLVVTSGLAGLAGSIWLSLYLRGLPSLREADWGDVTLLDWRVLALLAAMLLVLALAVSLAPILGIKGVGIAAASRSVSARAAPAQRLAGTVQVSIAGVLVAAAIAFGWHLASLTYGDAGYVLSDRYFVEYLGRGNCCGAEERYVGRERRREAIESIPGVTAVAFGYPIPGVDATGLFPRQVPYPGDPSRTFEISRGFFEDRFIDVLGLDLLYGRAPAGNEDGVVVVNQTVARTLWGRDDVVGERLFRTAEYEGFEIVGVVKDLSFTHPLATAAPYAFEPLGYATWLHGIVDTQLSAAELQQALAGLTRDGALDFEFNTVRPLAAIRSEVTAPDRVRGSFTIAAAALVVLLSGLGFYSTQRYLVSAGRREYAIRASLGAGPGALGRLVLLRGLMLGSPGLVLAALPGFIVVAWLRGDFISRDISPVSVVLGVLLGMTALLFAASLGPAGEARRTQPAPLLRED